MEAPFGTYIGQQRSTEGVDIKKPILYDPAEQSDEEEVLCVSV